MNNKTKWNDFVARRRLNPKEWVKSKGIKNYPQLVNYCQTKNIEPPTVTESKKYFSQPKLKKVKTKEENKVTLKEKTESLKAEKQNALEVEENENLISDTDKKQTVTTKSPKKKRGRKKIYSQTN